MTGRELIEAALVREIDPEKRKFWEREVIIQDYVDRFGYVDRDCLLRVART